MTGERFKVAIVGGGIGGLFTANALIKQGLAVTVYEQAPKLGEVGAGIYLTPNSVRHLQRLGLESSVKKYGARVGADSRYYRHDGSEIAPVQVTDSSGWNATFGMHRADMIDLLAEPLPQGVVQTGHECTGFEQDGDVARVTFANGKVAEAGIVIGCDGIHSALRPVVVPPSVPVFSGSAAYRGVIARKLLPDWPADVWRMWLGEGKHFLVFPLRAGTLLNFVGFVPGDTEIKESWTAPGDPDLLRKEFAGWDQRIEKLLGHVEQTFRWALYDRDPLPTWTKGRLTLLGDAAHAMLPHLGQGANQSMEDGMALATILAGVTRETAQAALVAYENLRRQRVADVQLGARKNGLRYDSIGTSISDRDVEIVAHASFRKSIYDYDVVREVARPQ
ncbi:MAG: NAD(P)-binding protein [Proteobacteria bacterium]|jgi:salicylate hydroxylase|nr:NAD(P)-binding protein [Pseudomonadota bacterium]